MYPAPFIPTFAVTGRVRSAFPVTGCVRSAFPVTGRVRSAFSVVGRTDSAPVAAVTRVIRCALSSHATSPYTIISGSATRTARAASVSEAPVVIRSSTSTIRPPASSRPPPPATSSAPARFSSRCREVRPDWSATARSLPQHTEHPGPCPRAPQFPGGGERDPPRRVLPACPHRRARRRHGHEQHTLRPASPLAQPCPYGPCQGRSERCRERQRTSFLVGEECRPYLVLIGSRHVHHRQPVWFRHRSHPARCGSAQGGTALRAEHRARLPTASALGRQHQVGEVLPPSPHAHHCANARAPRPPLWKTTCGQLPSTVQDRPPHERGPRNAPCRRRPHEALRVGQRTPYEAARGITAHVTKDPWNPRPTIPDKPEPNPP